MIKNIGELNSFNLGTLRDEEAASVALYHYFKNQHQDERAVTPGLINSFFADALQLPHWEEKRQDLYNDILDLLRRFYSQPGHGFNFSELWDLTKIQLFLINQNENHFAIIQNFEKKLLTPGESLRIIIDENRKAIALRLLQNGEMIVRTYTNLARLEGFYLLPLSPDQEIHYDQNLELRTDCVHILKPSPHSQVRFRSTSSGIEAQFISGYAFRQSQFVEKMTISQEPRLFYPLKRLERLFVQRSSDPYYIELIATLEKAIQMAKTKTQESYHFAKQAFEGGQIAFDQIFPQDKALYMRLRELAKLISVRIPTHDLKESHSSPEIHR